MNDKVGFAVWCDVSESRKITSNLPFDWKLFP